MTNDLFVQMQWNIHLMYEIEWGSNIYRIIWWACDYIDFSSPQINSVLLFVED